MVQLDKKVEMEILCRCTVILFHRLKGKSGVPRKVVRLFREISV